MIDVLSLRQQFHRLQICAVKILIPLNSPMCMLLLMRYQVLNFIKKPQCYKVLKISESLNASFPIMEAGAKHHRRYLGLVTSFDLNVLLGTCVNASDIFNIKHLLSNALVPSTVSPPLHV